MTQEPWQLRNNSDHLQLSSMPPVEGGQNACSSEI